MFIEPSWFSRFWEYSTTVIGYWQFWVAVAFMIERSLERFLPNVSRRVDPYLTPSRRRTLFLWIAAIAFVYANFRAYDDVRAQLAIAQTLLNQSISDTSQKRDRTAIKTQLRKFYTLSTPILNANLPKDISKEDFVCF
jgi:hypothetical protein